ncbi:MAG: phage tail protein [Flammeovirgaceae bacterium]|jgi:phage tail-like protein|nr:phage tail protein [Flammeovirgaceae bacterium]
MGFRSLNYTGSTQNSNYPLPAYYFQVSIPSMWSLPWGFEKVSGLEVKTNVVKYAHGNINQPYNYNIMGRSEYSDITFERGVFAGNGDLYDWWYKNLSTPSPRQIIISLGSNDMGGFFTPEVTWTLVDAMPVQLTFTELDAKNSSTPSVEKLVVCYRDMSILVNTA